jgi:hypothetical protein
MRRARAVEILLLGIEECRLANQQNWKMKKAGLNSIRANLVNVAGWEG